MAQQLLNHPDVLAGFEEMRRKRAASQILVVLPLDHEEMLPKRWL